MKNSESQTLNVNVAHVHHYDDALALAVTESLRVPVETKRLVGILATGFTLFTLWGQ